MYSVLQPWKGQEIFLQAIAKVNARYDKPFRVLIAGSAPKGFEDYPDRLQGIGYRSVRDRKARGNRLARTHGRRRRDGQAIQRLLSDLQLRRSLGLRAREFALREFRPTLHAQKVVELYHDVLGNQPERASPSQSSS